MDHAPLLQFTQALDAAAATSKKLQKQAALADYFRSLEEQDLRLAVRFAAGRAFAATDERVLNVGGALVSEVTLDILGLDPAAYHDLVVRSGEIGEALSKVWDERRTGTSPRSDGSPAAPPRDDADAHGDAHAHDGAGFQTSLTLRDLMAAFDELASTGVRERKRAILHDLFVRCATGREAAYVAKVIFRDLRTGVQEGVLQASVALAFDKPLAAVQRCQLLVGDLDEVAALAKRDALDTAAFRLFHPIQFMLATPQETAEIAADTLAGRPFFAEDKLDGIRAQIHKAGDGPAARVAIYTRTMDRTDASFPDVVDAVSKLPGEFLLDGEIVPYRDGQVLPFAHIQKRLGRKVLTAKILRENPAAFVAFDVLYRDGQLLMDCPLRDRRAALEALARGDACPSRGSGAAALVAATPASPRADTVEVSATTAIPATPSDGAPIPSHEATQASQLLTTTVIAVTTAAEISTTFGAARDRRNEGVILKDPDSLYSPGRRGKWWLKLKTHLPTFDCVVTAAETGHGKRKNWLSDYTFAVWDRDPAEPDAKLVNVGKAFTGLTDEEIVRMTELFTSITTQQWGRVRAVTPQVVLEIACDQIQKSARHASGYALRFPRIKRIRWDKRPEDADRLARIVEIYESTTNFAKPATAVPPAPAEWTLFD